MQLNDKTERIILWRDYLETLPNDIFLDIMRNYLGAIKTPFNKQKLVEDLSAFLRKSDVKQKICSLLCTEDMRIIAAVTLMRFPTQDKLAQFFKDTTTAVHLDERLYNLQERLVLFYFKQDGKTLYAVNPHLEEEIALLNPCAFLFKTEVHSVNRKKNSFLLNSGFLASFINYVSCHPDCCKNDGKFKKKTLNDFMFLYSAFEQQALQALAFSFVQLGIFCQCKDSLTVEWSKLKAFAELPCKMRNAYITVASCGFASRLELASLCRQLLDVLASVPKEGLAKKSIMQLAYLAQEKDEDAGGSRFSSMLKNTGAVSSAANLLSCLDFCITLGVLFDAGTSGSGETVYAVDEIFFADEDDAFPCIELDASGTVTVLSSSSLLKLLPLCGCLSLVQFDVAAVYRLDKHSAFRAFNMGETDKTVLQVLKDCCPYPIPQSVAISLEEWYSAFNSVMLYHGYVVKVSDSMRNVMLKSGKLKNVIYRELSPGVFILNCASDEEALNALQGAGFEERKIQEPSKQKHRVIPLPLLPKEEKLFDADFIQNDDKNVFEQSSELLSELNKKLLALDLPAEQKEILQERIERRLVVLPSQLNPESVRFERREAGGIDYQGKLYVIEDALMSCDMLELKLDAESPAVRAYPVELNKKSSDADLVIAFEDGTTKTVSVGAIIKIKRVKQSLDFN